MVLRFTEESINKYFSFALAYMVSFLCFLNTTNGVLGIVGISGSLDTLLLYGSIWAVILFGVLLVLARARNAQIDVVLLIGGIGVAYLMSYLFFPQNTQYMKFNHPYYVGNPIYALFIFSLPAYAFVRQLTDYTYFKKYLTVFSYISVILSIITFFFARDTSAAGYMTLSYNMLLHLFYLMITKTNHRVFRFIVVIAGTFTLVFGGARGALISLLAGIVIYLLFKKMDIRKKILLVSSVFIALLVILFFSGELIYLVSNFLKSFNIESRSFEKLVSLEFFDETGRDVLREMLLSNLSFFGSGLYGDRVLLGGSYSHNILLELITQFGFVIGPLLFIGIMALIIKGILKKDSPEWILIVAFLPHGIVSLMFSGTYLSLSPCFYILLGLCVNGIIKNRNDSIQKVNV